MGSFTHYGSTGSGCAQIDGGNFWQVGDIIATVQNAGNARILDTQPMRRYAHLGWFGLGCCDNGTPGDPGEFGAISHFWWINFDQQDYNLEQTFSGAYVSNVYWELCPGAVVDIGVNW